MKKPSYYQYTTKSRFDKSVNTFLGILLGISADRTINYQEMELLGAWLRENEELDDLHPYNEFLPHVRKALSDGHLDDEEYSEIIWLAKKLTSTEYYNQITADIQSLNAILGAIVADRKISPEELHILSGWLEEHAHLRSSYPYDEVDSLLTTIIADNKINEDEHRTLMAFFGDFLSQSEKSAVSFPKDIASISLSGICAVAPQIEFLNKKFVLTGESSRYTRDAFTEIIVSRGGKVTGSVSPKTNYVIVGAESNPCWAYACYGRKIETAMNLRKEGHSIIIVHENDLHDVIS